MNSIISNKNITRFICVLAIIFLMTGCNQYNFKTKDEAKTINVEIEKTEEPKDDDKTEEITLNVVIEEENIDIAEKTKDEVLTQDTHEKTEEFKIEVYELKLPSIDALKPYVTDTEDEVRPYISVPQITPVNDEIKYYNRQMVKFAEFLIDNFKMDEQYQAQHTGTASYESYVNNGILSVITKHNSRLDGRKDPFMNSINVEMTTGHVLTADEMMKRAGIINFAPKLDSVIMKELKKFEYYLSNEPYQYLKAMMLMTNWNQYFQLKSVFEDNYSKHEKEYRPLKPYAIDSQMAATFLDENGELVYILNVNAPVGVGVDQVIFYPKNEQDYEPGLNKAYEYFAQNLEIDPKSEESPVALIAYIGGLLSSEPAEKLNEILMNSHLKLTQISKIKANLDNEDKGTELYIVIPKYVDTCMYLYTVVSEDQPIPLGGTTQMILMSTNSNSSDGILIRIQHRDKLVLYSTRQNEEGILNNIPMEIMDISDFLVIKNGEVPKEVKNFIEGFIMGQD